jgi:hypothetical protein
VRGGSNVKKKLGKITHVFGGTPLKKVFFDFDEKLKKRGAPKGGNNGSRKERMKERQDEGTAERENNCTSALLKNLVWLDRSSKVS